jgi:enoyl-CoA hydratase
MTRLLRTILEAPVPVIAAVDGHVRAGGMGLIGACDIAVAGPASTFALTEARIRRRPVDHLADPAAQADRAGRRPLLPHRGEVRAGRGRRHRADHPGRRRRRRRGGRAHGQLAKASPQGLAASKALTTAAILAGFDAHAEELTAQSARLFVSDEAREGMLAFLQKRRVLVMIVCQLGNLASRTGITVLPTSLHSPA